MRKPPWITYVWPGLPQVWAYGNWSGLALALGAAGVFDVLLLVSFGWSELIGPSWRITLWVGFIAAWAVTVGWSARQCRRLTAVEDVKPGEDPFGKALEHYLKGDYYQTERILESVLRRNIRDIDARLLLATALRRDKRFEEAERQLDALVKFEDAGRWELEIQDERDFLAEAKAALKTASAA